MSEACPPIEDLGRVLALPAGHPDRAHAERCTRCQSLADMLREFESPAAVPPEAGFESNDARLQDTIAQLTGVSPGQMRGPLAVPVDHAPKPSVRPSWWSALLGPRLQLAGAFAALLLVSAAGVALWRGKAAPPAMRDAGSPRASAFAAQPAQRVAGGIELRWNAASGADAYRVVFLDGSLREIAHLEPVAATSARVDGAALPAGLVRGASVGWQVEALAGGDRVSVTPVQALRVP